jgi:hypothetical protein
MTVVSFLSSRVEGKKLRPRYYPRAWAALQALLKRVTNFDSFDNQSDKNVGTPPAPVATHSGSYGVNRHSCR